MTTFKKFLRDESGATAIEYSLIAALIAVVLIGILGTLGKTLNTKFVEINTALGTAGKPAAGATNP